LAYICLTCLSTAGFGRGDRGEDCDGEVAWLVAEAQAIVSATATAARRFAFSTEFGIPTPGDERGHDVSAPVLSMQVPDCSFCLRSIRDEQPRSAFHVCFRGEEELLERR
jgi:hypothetical protein